jgi:small subunit ribosomal protein S3Ae
MSKDQTKKGLARVNTAKKVWYRIVGPKAFGQLELGETYLTSPETAMGRNLKINLKDLTGNMKDQNAYVKFTVDEIDGTTLKASASGFELTATYVKRMVRKNTNRLDDYLVFKTKDGKNVVIKTLLVTQSKAQRSVLKQLRQKMKSYLGDEVNKNTFENVIINLVSRKTQMTLKKILYKIYPVNEAAVRVLTFAKNNVVEMQVEPSAQEQPAAEESSEEMPESAEEDDTALPEAA